MTKTMNIFLASSSPQRKRLLSTLVSSFSVRPSDFPERSVQRRHWSSDEAYIRSIAVGKVLYLVDTLSPEERETSVVIGGDLMVFAGEHEMGKPADMDEAARFTRRLFGATHTEIGALAVWSAQRGLTQTVSMAQVSLPPLSDEELARYLALAAPLTKAGAFSVGATAQLLGADARWQLIGNVTTILGLDTEAADEQLQLHGVPLIQSGRAVEAATRRDMLTQHVSHEVFGTQ